MKIIQRETKSTKPMFNRLAVLFLLIGLLFSCTMKKSDTIIIVNRYKVEVSKNGLINDTIDKSIIIKEIQMSSSIDGDNIYEYLYTVNEVSGEQEAPYIMYQTLTNSKGVYVHEERTDTVLKWTSDYNLKDSILLNVNGTNEYIYILFPLDPPIDANSLICYSLNYGILLVYSFDWDMYIYFSDPKNLYYDIERLVESTVILGRNFNSQR